MNLVVLTSPYSFPLEIILKLRKRSLSIIVHDFIKHEGDSWPPNWVIWIRNKIADSIIVLSQNVYKEVRKRNEKKPILVISHPFFDYAYDCAPRELDDHNNYVLFIGRIRAYKGVENLLEAINSTSDLSHIAFVIAGEGKINASIPKNVILINRWLTESEISFLINSASLCVFPYLEASQSGLIGTMIKRQKKILISSREGLLEQIEGYPNAWVTENLEPLSLGRDICKAFNEEAVITTTTKGVTGEFEKVVQFLRELAGNC
jgi:glycosyltransferase involved in cell wall biosynthesis